MRRAWAWITAALVIITWNVIFDRAVGSGAGTYLRAATASADSGHYTLVGEWMRSVTSRAFWSASTGAGGVIALSVLGAAIASKRRVLTPPSGE